MARKQQIPEKKINLELLRSLNNLSLWGNKIRMDNIPTYIESNLKHELRNYQFSALQNLDAVCHMDKKESTDFNQLMFYMATGSGKTDIMAATILYMYKEWGYQCFLFTVNTNAVVNKTIDNLTNSGSPKYLFSNPIVIDGQRVIIKLVNEFPITLERNTIYLVATGIQQLSNDFYNPRENSVTKQSLSSHKIIILADEAHHLNRGTKSSKKENMDSRSWEVLLDQIRGLNNDNLQLEFTATIDLHDPNIYNKYQNKIISQYDLGKFIGDGYSKRVYRLQAKNSDQTKMLNAVLLSQYRKRIAKNMGIPDFKPVILFKSNTIGMSKSINKDFLNMISNLSAEELQEFVQSQERSTQSEALSLAYKYWLKEDFAETVVELKRDFSEFTTVNANDSGMKDILDDESVARKINTLESPDNPIRSIFAVAKLSEGWDVLNLYDIVRIGEKSGTSKDTNAEAQLIGRGARYNPFIYEGKKSYRRRFDDRKPEIKLLERLYYHTINDPKYLENLRKSLDAINLPVNEDTKYKVYSAKVKSKFKNTNVYKYGNIYYNKVERVPESYFDRIQRYGFDPEATDPIDMVETTAERRYDSGADKNNLSSNKLVYVASFSSPKDKALIRTAVSFNDFYRYAKLKKYCPTLTSVREFLTGENWLGNAVVKVRVAEGTVLTPQKRLIAVERFLARVQSALTNNFKRSKGTNEFLPVAIKEVVRDYKKRVSDSFNDPKSANIGPYSMAGKDWFVYDYAIVDELEKRFIEQVGAEVSNFNAKKDKIYLFRIDEHATDFKLHDFGDDVFHYEGYMPDFILYMEQADFIYQIYMEPKGESFVERDRWKEELLEKIKPENIKVVGKNDDVKLYGVKFYLRGDKHQMFKELEEKGFLKRNKTIVLE